MPRLLEVPLDSLEAARLAAPVADRLELCDDLASEGWTPTMELIRQVCDVIDPARTRVVSMIRPRSATNSDKLDVAAFTTTKRILDDCRREIEASAKAGAHDVAVGLLARDGVVDVDACGRLVELGHECGMGVAFLRTFDLLTDRARGMDDITSIGISRVLTAGVLGWDAAVLTLPERLAVLADDVQHAADSAARRGVPPVEVLPGGGVRASNAAEFLTISSQLHASCRRDGTISADELRALREALDQPPGA